ncbi:unnamed protein product [Paramecium primaurelia]|uniref:Protein kinase domain-containing protein n=1 Tax=Paramecium primaurelia TaxID=5886 RepID=A0A8S1Q1C0_PARPR|nr:unnamed protein product [Paramecium primaurelia]
MGSCQGTTQDIQQDLRMREIMSQFQVPMPYTEEYQIFQTLKWLEIIQHNTIPNFGLIYSKAADSQNKLREFVKKWRTKYEQHNHPNLLSIHNISIIESMKVFIPYTEIILLMDKPLEPLSRHKKVIMKQQFNQDEIIFLLDCVVAAFSFQQTNKIYPSGFDIDDIIIVKTPFNIDVYKLVDRYQKPIRQNLFQEFIQLYDDKQTLNEMKKTAFLSPAQIQAIPRKDKYLKHNRYKSDVFNFGLMLIYLIQAKKPEVYDWKRWTIDDFALRKVQDDLITTNFNEQILHLIEMMLKVDEHERPDFIQLDEMVNKLFLDLKKHRLLEQYQPQEFFIAGYNKPSSFDNLINQNIFQSKYPQSPTMIKSSQHLSKNQQIEQQKYRQQDTSQASIKDQKWQEGKTQETKTGFENSVTQGKLHYSNGFYYIGQICNRRRHGLGTYYDSENQKVTEGMWVFDIPEGEVTFYNKPKQELEKSHKNLARKDWIQYKGQVKHGQKHGIGVLYFADGSKFMGTFSCDQAHGKGQFEYQSKECFIGTWQHDLYIS